jgi:hypothetical protein
MSNAYYIPTRGTGRSVGPGKYNPKIPTSIKGVTVFSDSDRYKVQTITPRYSHQVTDENSGIATPSTISKKLSMVTIKSSISRLSTPKRINRISIPSRSSSPVKSINSSGARFPENLCLTLTNEKMQS